MSMDGVVRLLSGKPLARLSPIPVKRTKGNSQNRIVNKHLFVGEPPNFYFDEIFVFYIALYAHNNVRINIKIHPEPKLSMSLI